MGHGPLLATSFFIVLNRTIKKTTSYIYQKGITELIWLAQSDHLHCDFKKLAKYKFFDVNIR